jgi:hypothetical protein
VLHVSNPRAQEVEAECCQVQGHPGLHNETLSERERERERRKVPKQLKFIFQKGSEEIFMLVLKKKEEKGN